MRISEEQKKGAPRHDSDGAAASETATMMGAGTGGTGETRSARANVNREIRRLDAAMMLKRLRRRMVCSGSKPFLPLGGYREQHVGRLRARGDQHACNRPLGTCCKPPRAPAMLGLSRQVPLDRPMSVAGLIKDRRNEIRTRDSGAAALGVRAVYTQDE